MGHFEGREDKQVYVGDDGKVYATPAEDKVLADSVDAFFGNNGEKPDEASPKSKKEKKPRKKETRQRKIREDRFVLVNCPECGKAVKKGAGLSNHMRMAHPEEE